MAKLVVIGSINMDVVNRVEQHPLPGQTVHSIQTSYHPGGKGANQAVSAARAGAAVRIAGAVGNDLFGPVLLSGLAEQGIQTDGVLTLSGTSGLAFITVDSAGENSIILSSGANGEFSPKRLGQLGNGLDECSAVLLQNEIPWETTFAAMKLAKQRGKRVYFNPAPAIRLPEDAYPLLDCLILNETEAAFLTGLTLESAEQEDKAMRMLLERGVKSVILTLGSNGLFYGSSAGEAIRLPAFPVEAVDTTAAGDTFIGAYAAFREGNEDVEASLRFAAAAAAIAVTRRGAQESVPSRGEVLAFLQTRPNRL